MKICCLYAQAKFDYQVNTKDSLGLKEYKIKASILPLGISYIQTVLKQKGHNVYSVLFIQDYTVEKNFSNIDKDTDLFCISITAYNCWNYINPLLSKIKEFCPKAKIIVGGAFVTLTPEEVIKNENIDALCIGEGEIAIVKYIENYINKIFNQKIDNLWIRENGTVIKCDKSVFIEDIDTLPYPDRHMWDKWAFDFTQHKVLTERGCPYKCFYCANHKLARRSQGKYYRYRKIEKIVDEIKNIKKEYPETDSILFYSENIAFDLDRLKELCIKLKEYNDTLEKKICFSATLNVTKNLIRHKEVFKAMREANFNWVMFGFENASKDIRKKLNRPDYDNRDILRFCNEMHKNKIKITIYAMLCYPYDTPKTYFETVKWLSLFKADCIGWTFMRPPENTDLYEKVVVNKENESKKTLLFNLRNWWYFLTLKFRVYPRYKDLMEALILSLEEFKIFNTVFVFWRRYNNKKLKNTNKNINLAKTYFDNGDFKLSLKYYNKIKYLKEAWIYADIAMANNNLNNFNGALKNINNALKLEPENNNFLKLKEEIINKIK